MECVLTGWGKIGEDESEPGDSFGQPWRLRQTTLPLVSDDQCHDIYLEGAGFTIQETMQCAGGDGQTDYEYFMYTTHVSYFLSIYSNLYRYIQQGFEAMILCIKCIDNSLRFTQ